MEEVSLGPYCTANNITVDKILNAEPYSLDITNGVALEISEAHPMSGRKSNLQLIMRLGGYNEVEIFHPKLINRLRTRLGRAAKRSKKYKPEKRPEYLNMDFLESERKFRAGCREASSTPPLDDTPPLDAHPPPPHSMCASTSSSLPSCSTGSPRLPVDDADSGEDDNPEDDVFGRIEMPELGRGKRHKKPQCWATHVRKIGFRLTALSSRRKRKLCSSPTPEMRDREDREPKVDFDRLKLHSLRQYGKHFKMNHSRRLSKSELAVMCSRHFHQIEVNPDEVMRTFMKKVARD